MKIFDQQVASARLGKAKVQWQIAFIFCTGGVEDIFLAAKL
jgi:hypothetical protein